MAFNWTQDIDKGDTCDVADLTEIRTNVDSIKDNLANVTYDSGVDNGDDAGYYGTNYPGYDNDENTGVDTSDNSSALNNDHGTYYSAVELTYDKGYDTGVNNPDYLSNDTSYCTAEDIGHDNTVNNVYQGAGG